MTYFRATHRTPEEKAEIVSKVDDLIKDGMSKTAATKQVGIAMSRYYAWGNKTPNVTIHDTQAEEDAQNEDLTTSALKTTTSAAKCLLIITDTTSAADLIRQFQR